MHRDGESARERQRQQQRADHCPPPLRSRSSVRGGTPLLARPDLGFQGSLGLEDLGQPSIASPQPLRPSADTTAFPERHVLGFIDPFGAGQEGRDLLHESPVLPDPRPVEHDPAHADHARGPAQRQRLHEQVPERRQVLLAEFGDRPIVRRRASGQPPKGHIIDALAFDHPRRPHSGGVGVQQERHQPRIVGQPTARLGVRARMRQDPHARRPIRQRAGPSVPPASGHSAPPTIDDRAEHTERLVRRATSASPSWSSARCPRPTLNNLPSASSSAAHHSALRPSTPSPRPACCRLRLALSSNTSQRSMTMVGGTLAPTPAPTRPATRTAIALQRGCNIAVRS